jgi:hypothetical protein
MQILRVYRNLLTEESSVQSRDNRRQFLASSVKTVTQLAALGRDSTDDQSSPRMQTLGLEGEDAASMLDLMQQVSQRRYRHSVLTTLQWLDLPSPPEPLPTRQSVINVMIRLAKSSQRLPPSLYVTGVELDANAEPAVITGITNVFKGRRIGQLVALKRSRGTGIYVRDTAFQVTCSSSGLYHLSERAANPQPNVAQQAIIWRQLKHNNIIPFIGVDQLTFDGYLCLVAPWMGRGTLKEYTGSDDFKRSRDAYRVVRL